MAAVAYKKGRVDSEEGVGRDGDSDRGPLKIRNMGDEEFQYLKKWDNFLKGYVCKPETWVRVTFPVMSTALCYGF